MFVFLLVFVEINCSLGHFFYWGFIVYGNGNPQSQPEGVTRSLLLLRITNALVTRAADQKNRKRKKEGPGHRKSPKTDESRTENAPIEK